MSSEKKFQVFTGTFGIMSRSYIVPEEFCWDKQQLVFEADSIKEISKKFKRRADYKWKENSTFRHQNLDGCCLELHCKSNQEIKIYPPKILSDGNWIYPIPKGGKNTKASKQARERAYDQPRDDDGKFMKEEKRD